MPIDPYLHLAQHCDRIGRHRAVWVPELDLHGVATVEDLLRTVRDRDSVARSDEALRALARAAPAHPDAVILSIGALAPVLRFWLNGTRTTAAYREEALGDLTVVVLEAMARGDFDQCADLARRLVVRAHVRVHKRSRKEWNPDAEATVVVEPCPPDLLVSIRPAAGLLAGSDPVADQVAATVDLERFGAACQAAVSAGKVPDNLWTAYRDHRLRRVFVAHGAPASEADRKRAQRGARGLQRIVDQLLEGHAA